jgi:aspartate-semialdehyde dehydrogenase
MKTYTVAVVGATGVVGKAILEILHERNFPAEKVVALASSNSVGETLVYANKTLDVVDVAEFDFSCCDIAFFTAGEEVSITYAEQAVQSGCIVIDNTAAFRMDPKVPLVIPEVNADAIANYHKKNIIANPNCIVIQMLMALKPIVDAVGIKSIDIATYQSVAGNGRKAISELVEQATALLSGQPVEVSCYPQQIAFNLIPHIDSFNDNGFTQEEMKLVTETHKILHDESIKVNATTVRVPVLYGHSAAVHIETHNPITPLKARTALARFPGVQVLDDPTKNEYPTPFNHAIGNDNVLVGRIRSSLLYENGLNLWMVADNIRKGAALNSVQIAEILVNRYI